jgi:hypothetical protein
MALLAGGRGAEAATLAAAFVLVKRAREMLFAAVGYVLLLLPNGSRRMALDGEPGLTAWGTL